MGHTGTRNVPKSPTPKEHCQNNCQHGGNRQAQLPGGLVGSRSAVDLSIGKIKHTCLIDSGSQVTTISKSFQETHLSSYPLFSLDNLLEVEGAAGHTFPI